MGLKIEPAVQDQRRERIILLVLAAVQFTNIVDFMVIMPLGPQLMRAFEIAPAEFSVIVSSYTFAAGIAGLVASSVIDRFSRRTAFLVLYAGFLVGTLLCAVAPSFWLLVAARVVTGAFGGILGGIAMAIVGDVFPEERRGRATGTLMSAFALASVAGVPLGLYVGTNYGWHVPFWSLVVLGIPVLIGGALVMPVMNAHLGKRSMHPLRALSESFLDLNHIKAFSLVVSLMIGGFAVIPFISPYLVGNVGMTEAQLPLVYICGGVLTLLGAPLIGRCADHYGKLFVYRVIAPISAVLMLATTVLPPVPMPLAVMCVGAFILSNAGRMIAAMAMITGSVEPRKRGGFMSANSSIQHLATGIGTMIGGLIITKMPDGRLENYGLVGLFGFVVTLASLWLAGRLRVYDASVKPLDDTASIMAAAEANYDVGEPMIGS